MKSMFEENKESSKGQGSISKQQNSSCKCSSHQQHRIGPKARVIVFQGHGPLQEMHFYLRFIIIAPVKLLGNNGRQIEFAIQKILQDNKTSNK